MKLHGFSKKELLDIYYQMSLSRRLDDKQLISLINEFELESIFPEKKVDLDYVLDEAGGAFYGPKIDFFVPDALGREWQLGTVQLDFSLPERFDLQYASEDGSLKRPVVVHRAMLGSLERFLGVLIEHTAGALPLWLSPLQAVVIPIADRHIEFGEGVVEKLRQAGARADVDNGSDRMGAKIRAAQGQKIPYMLVVGDREQEANQVAVRARSGGDLGALDVDEFVARIGEEIKSKVGNDLPITTN